jgi:hypothetical protein
LCGRTRGRKRESIGGGEPVGSRLLVFSTRRFASLRFSNPIESASFLIRP